MAVALSLAVLAMVYAAGSPAAQMTHLALDAMMDVVAVVICGVLTRGFVYGWRLAWYVQNGVAVIAIACLPLVLLDLSYALIPAAGGGILYHWRSPAIRGWFGFPVYS